MCSIDSLKEKLIQLVLSLKAHYYISKKYGTVFGFTLCVIFSLHEDINKYFLINFTLKSFHYWLRMLKRWHSKKPRVYVSVFFFFQSLTERFLDSITAGFVQWQTNLQGEDLCFIWKVCWLNRTVVNLFSKRVAKSIFDSSCFVPEWLGTSIAGCFKFICAGFYR